ncbi:MAG: hypothetical protein ACK5OX_06005 [Desertimonas sp.]
MTAVPDASPAEATESLRAEYGRQAAGLVRDLEAVGVAVDRLRDLRRRGVDGAAAKPVLLRWLPHVSFAPLKIDVVFALGAQWARPEAAPAVIAELATIRDEPGEAAHRVRAAICTTLERVADDDTLDDVIAIVHDRQLGMSRGMAVVAIGNARRRREHAHAVLHQILHDEPTLELVALLGLSKLGDRSSRPAFVARLDHPDQRIRRLAIGQVARWSDDLR